MFRFDRKPPASTPHESQVNSRETVRRKHPEVGTIGQVAETVKILWAQALAKQKRLPNPFPDERIGIVIPGGSMLGSSNASQMYALRYLFHPERGKGFPFSIEPFEDIPNPFESAHVVIGVSAGGLNAWGAASSNPNIVKMYSDIIPNKRLVDPRNPLAPLKIDRIVDEIGRFPVDLTHFPKLITVATNYETGEPVYHELNGLSKEDQLKRLKQSAYMPRIARGGNPKEDGVRLIDGGPADPWPIEKAITEGANRILVFSPHGPEDSQDLFPKPFMNVGTLGMGGTRRRLLSLTERAQAAFSRVATSTEIPMGAIVMVVNSINGFAYDPIQISYSMYNIFTNTRELLGNLISKDEIEQLSQIGLRNRGEINRRTVA